jgi:hypothetical protein
MNDATLRKKLLNLAQLAVDLNKKGGPEKAGRLFEKIIEKTDKILESLGLPSNPYYQGIVSFYDAIPWDNELDELIKVLHQEADEVAAAGPVSDIDILTNAKKSGRDPMFVLPQIKISTHIYPLWVYRNILLTDADSPENILAEFKTLMEGDYLGQIGMMDPKLIEDFESTVTELEEKGLRYIRQYAENWNSRWNLDL